jgi:predicted phosphodiesterase
MSTIWFLVDGTATAPPPSVIMANTKQVIELLQQYNVKAVLQGHTHIAEVIDYRGCQFISSGAVCGNWWRGPRMGHAEGFGLLHVRGTEITWAYREYGFQADPPHES